MQNKVPISYVGARPLNSTVRPPEMPAPVAASLAAFVVVLLGCPGCARESSAFPLYIETLRKLGPEDTAGITYNVDGEVVFVTVTDRYGDAHIHRLMLGEMTQSQAIELLKQKQKQIELGHRK